MPSNTAYLTQVGAIPSSSPRPASQPSGGSGPGLDLGPLLDALNPAHLFGDLLLRLTQQLDEALQTIWDKLWHSGVNVFTFTAPELTYRFGPVAELVAGMRLLVGAITALGIILAAASLAGREVFVWVQLAIGLNNRLCEAVGGATLFDGFRGGPVDTLSSGLLLLALLWFGLQLGLKMLYRIGLLWILIATAPLALACWAIPQAQWVATTWTRQFVGWTFGQVLVTIALKLGFVSGPFGPGGASVGRLLFSIVMAALAVELVDLLVYGSVPRFGAARGATFILRTVLTARAAIVSTSARAATVANQRRLPGF